MPRRQRPNWNNTQRPARNFQQLMQPNAQNRLNRLKPPGLQPRPTTPQQQMAALQKPVLQAQQPGQTRSTQPVSPQQQMGMALGGQAGLTPQMGSPEQQAMMQRTAQMAAAQGGGQPGYPARQLTPYQQQQQQLYQAGGAPAMQAMLAQQQAYQNQMGQAMGQGAALGGQTGSRDIQGTGMSQPVQDPWRAQMAANQQAEAFKLNQGTMGESMGAQAPQQQIPRPPANPYPPAQQQAFQANQAAMGRAMTPQQQQAAQAPWRNNPQPQYPNPQQLQQANAAAGYGMQRPPRQAGGYGMGMQTGGALGGAY